MRRAMALFNYLFFLLRTLLGGVAMAVSWYIACPLVDVHYDELDEWSLC